MLLDAMLLVAVVLLEKLDDSPTSFASNSLGSFDNDVLAKQIRLFKKARTVAM